MKMKKVTAVFFLAVVMGFMCLSFVSYGMKKTRDLSAKNETTKEIVIDWAKLYPFSEEGAFRERAGNNISKSLYDFVQEKCEEYTSKKLLGFHNMLKVERKYESLIGWNIALITDYNGVVKLSDDYFTTFAVRRNVKENAEAVVDFARYCEGNGMGFFYGNFPVKVCKYEDADVSGELDFANQNADEFLELLGRNEVKYYDFRKLLHNDGMNHHESFFRTDHHWKPETGLWAAKHILQILKDDYGWDTDPEILAPDKFKYVIYPEWFLGSQGKKVTLSRAKPEDFTLIYPDYETKIICEIPCLELNISGDFNITYGMEDITRKDYYEKDPFHAYNHGRRDFVRLTNGCAKNNKKLLLIDDSFCNAVTPFLALGIRQVEAIDLRQFTGSIKSFIDQHKPDLVAVLYSGAPGGIFCDFR